MTPEQLAELVWREQVLSGSRRRIYIDPAMIRPPLPYGLRRWVHSKGCRQWQRYRHQPCLLLILRPVT